MLTLFGYNISPYAAKVRAVLRYKGVPFEERVVHPLERSEMVRRSRQNAIPIIDGDETVVAESTRIAAYLDGRNAAGPLIRSRTPGATPAATLLPRLGEALDLVAAALAESEPAQHVADASGGATAPSLADGKHRAQRASEPTPSA